MTATGMTPDLDLYDIAFLAGGVHRVVDTALVALVESGRVRVHGPGELAAVQLERRHPVEAAVLDAVGPRGHRSVDTIRWRLADDERLTGLGRSLSTAGLMRRRMLRGRGTWSPTRAGRQELLRLTEQPPVYRALDGGSALQVALRGREAMSDADLRAAIFERPALPKATGPEIGRRLRMARRLSDDPAVAAYQARTALGGAAAFGFFGGGGGGDGGGDGGGGG
jgi:hypothetical protein